MPEATCPILPSLAQSPTRPIEVRHHAIEKWIRGDTLLTRLADYLLEQLPRAKRDLYLVGGALRQPFVSAEFKAKDIDVVAQRVSLAELVKLPEARRNFFGGVTLKFDGVAVDIWPLPETYHIKVFGLPKDIRGFLAGAPLNLDKIAYNFTSRTLFDAGCLLGLLERTIAYAPAHPYLEHIQAVRVLLLQKKTGFKLHSTASSLLNRAPGLLLDARHDAEVRRYLEDVLPHGDWDAIMHELRTQRQSI